MHLKSNVCSNMMQHYVCVVCVGSVGESTCQLAQGSHSHWKSLAHSLGKFLDMQSQISCSARLYSAGANTIWKEENIKYSNPSYIQSNLTKAVTDTWSFQLQEVNTCTYK